MTTHRNNKSHRTGGIYIAVLGTALIVSLLGLATLSIARLQSHALSASADIRQAQLNAETAVALARLWIKQDENWRTNRASGRWFSNLATGLGTCTLDVTDPLDGNLADDPGNPILVSGIGYHGAARQRIELMIDPKPEPLGCLRSAVAAGEQINLSNDVLRVTGRLTASQITANASQVYGDVAATTISGATYYGTTTQVDADELPAMPDWATAFDYYRTNGTEINIANLPTTTPNLGRNVGMESGTTDWNGTPPGMTTSELKESTGLFHSGTKSFDVTKLVGNTSGAAQFVTHLVEPNKQFLVEAWVYLDDSEANQFNLSLTTKGSGAAAAQESVGPNFVLSSKTWTMVSATLTVPAWTGSLEYAFVKVGGPSASTIQKFYLDDFSIRDAATGRFIYRQLLSPSINPFGGPTNPQGIYWIDCNGNPLIIERSRILGTLLVVNPGAGSRIGDGPNHWSPAVPGYPALLVDANDPSTADFSLRATSRPLVEKDNAVNLNPVGSPHEIFGQESKLDDSYTSEISGLVAVRGDLDFQNTPLIRGQVIVGGRIANSSGTLEVEYQPDSVLTPPPGFSAPDSYLPRPGSTKKAILP